MAYEFDSTLETGHALIDSQHKELIKAVNDLYSACSAGKGREEVLKTVDFLEKYTAKHFSQEEELQVKYNYPDYVNHKRLHETFKKTVHDFNQKINADGVTISLFAEINHQIGDWLFSHIKGQDKKVAAHIKANL